MKASLPQERALPAIEISARPEVAGKARPYVPADTKTARRLLYNLSFSRRAVKHDKR
jgi:hypothetical protein